MPCRDSGWLSTRANAATASDVPRRHISPHVPAAAARPARGQPDRCPGSCAPPGVSDGALIFDLYKGRWMDRGIAARILGSENPRLGQDMAVVLVLVIRVQYPRSRTHNVEDVMFIAGRSVMRTVHICLACMLRRGRDIDPGLPQPPSISCRGCKAEKGQQKMALSAHTQGRISLTCWRKSRHVGCGEGDEGSGIRRTMPLEGETWTT